MEAQTFRCSLHLERGTVTSVTRKKEAQLVAGETVLRAQPTYLRIGQRDLRAMALAANLPVQVVAASRRVPT
jgi:hypothetical protein